MRLALAAAIVFAMGCHRSVGSLAPVEPTVAVQEVRAPEALDELAAGDRWSGHGICLVVPPAWTGRVDAAGALGTLHHDASGVSVSVRTFEASTPPAASREGYTLTFEDESAYRKIPVFEDGGTRTWTSNAPGGPTLKAWFGTVGGRCIQLEVLLPFGKAIEGTRAVEDLLTAISTTC